jgi:uncharacterized protein (TIGR02996 family)
MTHDEAFLQAIREAPDDDGPRLVYADWLDEHGQAERAEFIRVQCEQARDGADSPRAAALLQRARELLQAHWEEWVGPLREAARPAGRKFGENWLAGGFHAEGLSKFRRGFVDTLTLGAEEFLARTGVLARLVPLRHLLLRGAGPRAGALAAAPFLHGLEILSFVDYYDLPLTTDGARALASSPHLDLLRHLYLLRNDVGDAGLQALAAAPWLRGVQTLVLVENGLSAAGVRVLAGSPLAEHLESLWLDRNDLGDEGVAALAFSPLWPRLRKLSLNRAAVGREGIGVLAAAPSGTLTRLHLKDNPLGTVGAERLAGAASLSTLTVLHLRNCGLGDEGAEALARSPHLAGLEKLDLEANGITDRGARAVANSPHLRRLRSLLLADNAISDATLNAVSHLTAGATNLLPGP